MHSVLQSNKIFNPFGNICITKFETNRVNSQVVSYFSFFDHYWFTNPTTDCDELLVYLRFCVKYNILIIHRDTKIILPKLPTQGKNFFHNIISEIV